MIELILAIVIGVVLGLKINRYWYNVVLKDMERKHDYIQGK